MADLEFALTLFVYIQPPVLGLLLFLLARRGLLPLAAFSRLRGVRSRTRNVRFFECAVHTRLLGRLRYDIQILSFCALFILYDVDLLFFLAEATQFEWWSGGQAALCLLYLLFFLAGLSYDAFRYGFLWAL